MADMSHGSKRLIAQVKLYMLQPINFARSNLSYACAKDDAHSQPIEVVYHQCYSASKVCQTSIFKTSYADHMSHTSQFMS